MRDVAVVTGVLGAGCVLVFALAFLVSSLFPSGAVVGGGWGGGVMMDGKVEVAPPPLVMPAGIDQADGVPEK
jgi:hypothetical protein